MSRELQPPVLSVSLVNIKLPTVIKNESPASEIVEIGIDDILDSSESEEEIIPDVKGIDIVCEESIKSEILESKHCEFVERQVLVKAENSPFIQADNKSEDTNNEIVTKGTGQGVVDVQGSIEYSNVLSNLETDAQLVLNFSKDLNGSTNTRKTKQPEKTNFVETTSWEKDKEKIKVIKAPVIPVEAHEYITLTRDKHVCNYCQHVCNTLNNLKIHINKMHREATTMYQCPYCPYKSKWIIQKHIISKHKDTKDIQWFQCNLCEMKFKLKSNLTQHLKIHLKHKQMQDGLDLHKKSDISVRSPKPDHPAKTDFAKCYRTHGTTSWEKNKEKIKIIKAPVIPVGPHEYITLAKNTHSCNHCQQTSNRLSDLKLHIKKMHRDVTTTYQCFCCLYKSKWRSSLRRHIIHEHKDTEDIHCFRFHCNKCDYKTNTRQHLKRHKLTHLKPEDIPYFHCYHCSYKSNQKATLQRHIFQHLRNEEVKFDCYICNFMTQKRESIIEHIKKHSKVQIKFKINKGS